MSTGGSVRKYGTGRNARWRWDLKRADETAERGPDGRLPQIRQSGAGFATKKEAEAALKAAQAEAPSSAKPTDTLGKWLRVWLRTLNDLSERSQVRYETVVRLHLIPRLGGVPLRKLRGSDIAGAYAGMVADGLSPKSIQVVQSCLSRALSDAVRDGVLAANVARGVKLPADKRVKAPKALDTDGAQKLLTYLRDSPDVDARWSALFTLLTATGLRPGEALALRWRDVDLTTGAVTVRATLVGKADHGYPKVSTTKTDRSRTVVVPAGALGVLAAWKHVQPDQRVQHRLWKIYACEAASEQVPEQECWPVFTVPTGEVVSIDWTTLALTRICKEAGVKRMTPHGLRHTFATVSLERGVHPKVVSDWLGHASTAQTMETYSHVMPAHSASESERVGTALFG